MTQHQPEEITTGSDEITREKKYSDLAKTMFYLVASISLIIVMFMFIFVWQPIWEKGFNDFHTITRAINELNDTAKPASETVPLMLGQMTEMNQSIKDMKITMNNMDSSIDTLEQITPNLERMNISIDNMSLSLTSQMGRMSYLIGEMEDKFSPRGMMPYNW